MQNMQPTVMDYDLSNNSYRIVNQEWGAILGLHMKASYRVASTAHIFAHPFLPKYKVPQTHAFTCLTSM